jgi:hypothetical protein
MSSTELPFWLQIASEAGQATGLPALGFSLVPYAQQRAKRKRARAAEYGTAVRRETGLDNEQIVERLQNDEQLEELVERTFRAVMDASDAEHRLALVKIAAHGFAPGDMNVAECLLLESIVETLRPLDIAALRLLCQPRPVAGAGQSDPVSDTGGWKLAELDTRLPTMIEGIPQALLYRLESAGLIEWADTWDSKTAERIWKSTQLGHRLVTLLAFENGLP